MAQDMSSQRNGLKVQNFDRMSGKADPKPPPPFHRMKEGGGNTTTTTANIAVDGPTERKERAKGGDPSTLSIYQLLESGREIIIRWVGEKKTDLPRTYS